MVMDVCCGASTTTGRPCVQSVERELQASSTTAKTASLQSDTASDYLHPREQQQQPHRPYSPGFLCELRQIHTYAGAIKLRAEYLRGLVEPTVEALEKVREAKQVMKETHRMLEVIRIKTRDMEEGLGIGDTRVQAWQAYQGLVRIEEKLKGLAKSESKKKSLVETTRENRVEGGEGKKESGMVSIKKGRIDSARRESTAKRETPVAYVPSGAQKGLERVRTSSVYTPTPEELDYIEQGLEVYFTPGVGSSMSSRLEASPPRMEKEEMGEEPYKMSGALSRADGLGIVGVAQELQPVQPAATVAEIREESSGRAESEPGRRRAVGKLNRSHFGVHLAKTRDQVERECEEEEMIDMLTLNDGDRQREGSLSGYHVTMFMVCGIKDAGVVLPKLRYIKMHEVRELRSWLATKGHVGRWGNISRLEKVLCLVLLLQEGCRYEMLAVLFSRRPQEVQDGCLEVMRGLLELHSETTLPQRQVTCHGLWGISVVFFNVEPVVARATRYYGWDKADVVKVLVALNMFIGRYRQQGRLALSGPYFEWWRCFQQVTVHG